MEKIPFKRIVTCEDDLKIQRDLRIVCNTEFSRIVKEFYNGQEFYNWFLKNGNDVDLIILDIILKKIDGFALFHEVKNINSHIPIIILSIENSVPLIKYLLLNGAVDFIIKPYEFEKLKKRILYHIKK